MSKPWTYLKFSDKNQSTMRKFMISAAFFVFGLSAIAVWFYSHSLQPKVLLATPVEKRELAVLTVATDRKDGLIRFERSCSVHGLACTTLGMGQKWRGFGWKMNLIKGALEVIKAANGTMVMITDSYDVVMSARKETILAQFDKMGADILFAAEHNCWPDQGLKDKYPEVDDGRIRFLNAGCFIGPADLLAKMIEAGGEIKNGMDDQLFYTKIFINSKLREALNIKLDTKAELFQCLNRKPENIKLLFEAEKSYVLNVMQNSRPMVFHGNGPGKKLVTTIGKHLEKAWPIDE